MTERINAHNCICVEQQHVAAPHLAKRHVITGCESRIRRISQQVNVGEGAFDHVGATVVRGIIDYKNLGLNTFYSSANRMQSLLCKVTRVVAEEDDAKLHTASRSSLRFKQFVRGKVE